MNLLEISNEFDVEKAHPQDVLELLKRREKLINLQLANMRDVVQDLFAKINGSKVNATWDKSNPFDPVQKVNIDKQLALGFIPIMKASWGGGDHEHDYRIDSFVPDTPHNKALVSRIEAAFKREHKLENMRRDIPGEVRKAKSRLSTWKRKQPNYVGRETGKDVAKTLSDELIKELGNAGFPVKLKNQYYWKKNKMVVIEIATDLGHPSMKPWELMDHKIKPTVDKFLKDHGYSKVRLTSFYDKTISQSVLKLQIDDAEARDISKSEQSDETE